MTGDILWSDGKLRAVQCPGNQERRGYYTSCLGTPFRIEKKHHDLTGASHWCDGPASPELAIEALVGTIQQLDEAQRREAPLPEQASGCMLSYGLLDKLKNTQGREWRLSDLEKRIPGLRAFPLQGHNAWVAIGQHAQLKALYEMLGIPPKDIAPSL